MTATIHATSLPLSRGPIRRALQLGVGALLVTGAVGAGIALASARPAAPLLPGTARLIPGDAAVTVHRGTPVAAADALLRAGDTISVERGVATLRTSAGAIYARAGSAVAITDGAPRITKGDVLLRGHDLKVAMRAASTEVNGITRVRQGLSLEIAVYRGGAVVRTVTETVGLPRLRRALVAGVGGAASATVAPMVLDGSDAWDRKFLGDAIELDAVLNARSRGITLQVAGRGAALVDQVVATTGWKDLSVLSQQPIGEFVVAAELARAANLADGAANKAVEDALKLRADGAAWGLIALEQGVHSVPAGFAGLDDIVVPTLIPTLEVPKGTTPTTPTTTPGASTPKVTRPTPSTEPQPAVTVPPVPPAEPTNPVAGLVEGVDNLLGGLLGGLTGK